MDASEAGRADGRAECWEGSCLCGRVRYRAMAPLTEMVHCHCSDCRKRHGAAFATHVGVAKERFTVVRGEEALHTYVTRRGVSRRFCSVCGSKILSSSPQWEEVYFTAGTLESLLVGVEQLHVFVRSKVPWYDILDGSPQHEEYPPSWNVTGQTF